MIIYSIYVYCRCDTAIYILFPHCGIINKFINSLVHSIINLISHSLNIDSTLECQLYFTSKNSISTLFI